jgi:hypothetical protein
VPFSSSIPLLISVPLCVVTPDLFLKVRLKYKSSTKQSSVMLSLSLSSVSSGSLMHCSFWAHIALFWHRFHFKKNLGSLV